MFVVFEPVAENQLKTDHKILFYYRSTSSTQKNQGGKSLSNPTISPVTCITLYRPNWSPDQSEINDHRSFVTLNYPSGHINGDPHLTAVGIISD